MEDQLWWSIFIIRISLLFSTLCDIPYECLPISTSTNQVVLLIRMPLQHLDLIFMEHHFIETLARQSDVPDAHTLTTLHVFASKCKHIVIDIVKRAAISATYSSSAIE